MRTRISTTGSVHPSVCPSFCPSVRRYGRPSIRDAFVKKEKIDVFYHLKSRKVHEKARAYLQKHPHIYVRRSIHWSVGRSVSHDFFKFSENQPLPRNPSKKFLSSACHDSYHHAIIPSNTRTHRWPYGPCLMRPRISITGSVHPSVGRFVGRSCFCQKHNKSTF